MTEAADSRRTPATHNIVAAFLGRDKAREAVDALEKTGIPREEISVDARFDHVEVLRAEMREEVDTALAGPAISLYNKQMVKGAAFFTVVGTVVGVLLGLVVGLILSGTLNLWISVIAFGFGGSTVGFLAGGFSKPRPAEDARDGVHEARAIVGVHSENQDRVEQAGPVLQQLGAERLDRFDREGNPVPELQGRSGYETEPSKTGRPIEPRES